MEAFRHRLTDASTFERLVLLVVPLAAAFLLTQVALAAYNLLFHPLAGIPGPVLARSTNLWLTSKIFGFKRCFAIHDLFKEYKTDIVRIAPNAVAFQDASVMQKLYGKYAVKPLYYKGMQLGGYDHVMTVGPWEEHAGKRRLFNSVYAPAQLSLYQADLLDFCSAAVGRILKDGDNGKKSVDLSVLTKQFQFDVVALIGLGQRFDIVKDHPDHWLTKLVDNVMFQLGLRANFPKTAVKLVESLPIPAIQEVVAAQPQWNAYLEGLFKDTQKEIAESGADGPARETLISRMLRGRNEQGLPLDGEIRAEACAHLLAGTDTTSTVAGYMFYELSKQQHIQDKIFAEIESLTDDPSVIPTIAQVNALTYVSHVVKEALRVYMPTPGSLPRIVPEGGLMIAGRFIPAGTEACAQGWTSHRVKSVWGPDAEEFRPERWEDEDQAMRDHFMPYGLNGSPRQCPGHALATLDLKLLLCSIVRNFSVRADEKFTNEETTKMIETFVTMPVGGKMRFFCTPRAAA